MHSEISHYHDLMKIFLALQTSGRRSDSLMPETKDLAFPSISNNEVWMKF